MTDKPKPPTIEELEARNEAPWKTAPDIAWEGTPIDLYSELKGFFQDHIAFNDPAYYDVVTAWTLSTWHIGRYARHGPLIAVGLVETGKTTLLECEEEVAFRGIRGGSMSNATMFRLNDSMRGKAPPTFLLDETQVYNREEYAEMRAFLNERYKRGGKVWRVNTETLTPESFAVFGATVLAQSDQTNEALESRAIILKMETGSPRKQTLTEEFYVTGDELRGKLKHYAKIEEPFPDPSIELAKLSSPRLREIGLPLLSEAPLGEARDNILGYLVKLDKSRRSNQNTSYESDIFRAFDMAPINAGMVEIGDVRTQLMIMWDIPKLTDKRLPHGKTVMNILKTMGFTPDRTNHNRACVVYDPELVTRLRGRFGISSPSSVSSPGENEQNEKEGGRRGPNGRNPEGITVLGSKTPSETTTKLTETCEYCGKQMTRKEYEGHACPVGSDEYRGRVTE